MGRLDQEDETGIEWKREVRDRLCESTTNTKSFEGPQRNILLLIFNLYTYKKEI